MFDRTPVSYIWRQLTVLVLTQVSMLSIGKATHELESHVEPKIHFPGESHLYISLSLVDFCGLGRLLL